MEWGEIEIRKTEQSGVEAEIRGDMLNSGGDGCWVSIVGWGPTEDVARANLQAALQAVKSEGNREGIGKELEQARSPMIVPREVCVLAVPWSMHSIQFAKNFASARLVVFCDNGAAERDKDDVWHVVWDGPLHVAETFVEARKTPEA